MRKLIEFLIIVSELSNLIIFAKDYKCTLHDIPPVDILSPNATLIVNLIESQPLPADYLEDVMTTEARAIADLLKFKAAENSEDKHLNITQVIQKYGYKVEEHEVTTEDGYILTMFRIPGDGPPVFFMHGFLTSAYGWITVGPGSATPYYLADRGFDVWLGNSRSTKYTKGHVTIPKKCAEYWDFSFHEISMFDVSKMVDYILDKTGKSSLAYIGHSQSTACPLVLCSERPEYIKKINVIMLFSPVVPAVAGEFTSLKSNFLRIVALGVQNVYKFLGNREIDPDSLVIKTFISLFCADAVVTKQACSNLVFLAFGFNCGHLDINKLPVIAAHLLASVSVKELIHLGQSVIAREFRQFDYTKEKNMEVYGQEEPPSYNVEKVTVPVALFYSNNEVGLEPAGVNNLKNRLPNVAGYFYMDKYAHLDYLFDRDAKDHLFPKVLNLLFRFSY